MFRTLFLSALLALTLAGAEIGQCVHFLDRTSFGVDKTQLERCLNAKDYETYVRTVIFDSTPEKIVFPPAAQTLLPPPPKNATAEERKAYAVKVRENGKALQLWWINRMVETDQPFYERMAFFWHAHFTTELRKVRQPLLMAAQYRLFYDNALGGFGTLLHGIVENPAMLIYLDNTSNYKRHPNENLARELLELYTMGEGHYTEEDIKALAKALTGYRINRQKGFVFTPKTHDSSLKAFLGRKGNFNAHDAVEIILDQNATARFIVGKLWHTFVSETRDEGEIDRLSALFKANGYAMKPLLLALFTSPAFTDPANQGKMIKSPVELIVGMLRTFEYDDFDTELALRQMRTLGQEPFNPPNVRGWRGDTFWINAATLLQRKAFISRMTQNDMIGNLNMELFDLKPEGMHYEQFAASVLLPEDVFITPGSDFNQTLRTILRDPLYQLK